jgi:hypothetical protein
MGRHSRGWYGYRRPRNMTQAMSSVPILAALVLAGVGYELVVWLIPGMQCLGALGGAVIGMAGGFIGVKWYIDHGEKPPSVLDPSEEGTATDPDLYR